MKTRWIALLIAACAMFAAGSIVQAEPSDAPEGDSTAEADRPLKGPNVDTQRRGPRARMGEDGKRKGPRHHPGQVFRHLLRDLDLSDEQKTEIRDILKANGDKMREYRESNKEKIDEIREQMKAAREAKDREKMKQLHEQLKAIHEGRPVKMGEVTDQIRTKLTAEQRETFDERVAEMKEKIEEAREKRKQHMEQRREKAKDRAEGKRGKDKKSDDQPEDESGELDL